ncbi:hypothetical protein TGVEG_271370 [Toxoplasma gondii VEG]|uniref:Uncharacterized protein n=2 Tax=Toxoplasma gondii TaxID=5811 RepID=V5BM94_TOXGV|nr:hypothetical protein TGVEG_271370 [Toxoplasma gondii VEG]KFG51987.1 hypothetical protein TGP89_271370 [Toxoplasma gondii p89]CEL75244.1 TPA: hypothetical protein BN1205_018635 [Toxoplasma gondii VEG]
MEEGRRRDRDRAPRSLSPRPGVSAEGQDGRLAAASPPLLSPCHLPSSPSSGCREGTAEVVSSREEEILFSFRQWCLQLPPLLSQVASLEREKPSASGTESLDAQAALDSGVHTRDATAEAAKGQRRSSAGSGEQPDVPFSFASPSSLFPHPSPSFITPSLSTSLNASPNPVLVPSPSSSCSSSSSSSSSSPSSSSSSSSSCSSSPFSFSSARLSALFPSSALRLPARLLQWAETAVGLVWPCIDTPELYEALLELFLARVAAAFHLHAQRFLWAFADAASLHTGASQQLSLPSPSFQSLPADAAVGRCSHPLLCLDSRRPAAARGSSPCPLAASLASSAADGPRRLASSPSPSACMHEGAFFASTRTDEACPARMSRYRVALERHSQAGGDRGWESLSERDGDRERESPCGAKTREGRATQAPTAVPGAVALVPLSVLSLALLRSVGSYMRLLDFSLELASLLWCRWPSGGSAGKSEDPERGARLEENGRERDENETRRGRRRGGVHSSQASASRRQSSGEAVPEETLMGGWTLETVGGERKAEGRTPAIDDEDDRRDQARYEAYIQRMKEAAWVAAEEHRPPLAATFVEAFQSLFFTAFSRLRLCGVLASRSAESEKKRQEKQAHSARATQATETGPCRSCTPRLRQRTGNSSSVPVCRSSETESGAASSAAVPPSRQPAGMPVQCRDCEAAGRDIHEFCRLFDALQARETLAARGACALGAAGLQARPPSENEGSAGGEREGPLPGAATLHLLRRYDPLQGALVWCPDEREEEEVEGQQDDAREEAETRAVETALPQLYAAVTGAGPSSEALASPGPLTSSPASPKRRRMHAVAVKPSSSPVSSLDKEPAVGASGGSLDDLLLPFLSFSTETSEPLRLLLPFLNALQKTPAQPPRGMPPSPTSEASSLSHSASAAVSPRALSKSAVAREQGQTQGEGRHGRLPVYAHLLSALAEVRVQRVGDRLPGAPSVLLLPRAAVAAGIRGVQRAGQSSARRFEERAMIAEGNGQIKGSATGHSRTQRGRAEPERLDGASHAMPGCCFDGRVFEVFLDAAVEAVGVTGCTYTIAQSTATECAGESFGEWGRCASCSRWCVHVSGPDATRERPLRTDVKLEDVAHCGGRSTGSAHRSSSEMQRNTSSVAWLPCAENDAFLHELSLTAPVGAPSSPRYSSSVHFLSSASISSSCCAAGNISLVCLYLDERSMSPSSSLQQPSAASLPRSPAPLLACASELDAALRCLYTSPFFPLSFPEVDASEVSREAGRSGLGVFFLLFLASQFFLFLGQESLWRSGLFSVLLQRLQGDCLEIDGTSASSSDLQMRSRTNQASFQFPHLGNNRQDPASFARPPRLRESLFQPLLRLLTDHCHPFLALCWGGLSPFPRLSDLFAEPQVIRCQSSTPFSACAGAALSPFSGVRTPGEAGERSATVAPTRQRHLQDLDVGLCSLGVTALLLLREKRLSALARSTHQFPASLPFLADLRASDVLLRCNSNVAAGAALGLASSLFPRRREGNVVAHEGRLSLWRDEGSTRGRSGLKSEADWWAQGRQEVNFYGVESGLSPEDGDPVEAVFQVPLTPDAVGSAFRSVVKKMFIPHFLALLHARQTRSLERAKWRLALAAQLSAVLGRESRHEERRKVEGLFRLDLGAKEQSRRREEGFLLLSLGTLLAQLLLALHFLRVSPRASRRVLLPLRRFLLYTLSRSDLEALTFALLPALQRLDGLLSRQPTKPEGREKRSPGCKGEEPHGGGRRRYRATEEKLEERDGDRDAANGDLAEGRSVEEALERGRHGARTEQGREMSLKGVRNKLFPFSPLAGEALLQALASDAPGPACLCDVLACKRKAAVEGETKTRGERKGNEGEARDLCAGRHSQEADMESDGEGGREAKSRRLRRGRPKEDGRLGRGSSVSRRRSRSEGSRSTPKRGGRRRGPRLSGGALDDVESAGKSDIADVAATDDARCEGRMNDRAIGPDVALFSASALDTRRSRSSSRPEDTASWSYMVSLNWLTRSQDEEEGREVWLETSDSDEAFDGVSALAGETDAVNMHAVPASPACSHDQATLTGVERAALMGQTEGGELNGLRSTASQGGHSWPWGGGARGRRRTLLDFYVELVGGPLRFAAVYRQRLAKRLADVNFFALVKQAERVNEGSGVSCRPRGGEERWTETSEKEEREAEARVGAAPGVSTAPRPSEPIPAVLRLYAEARGREAAETNGWWPSRSTPAPLDPHALPRLLALLASLTDYVEASVVSYRGQATALSLFPFFAGGASDGDAREDAERPMGEDHEEEETGKGEAARFASCRIMLNDARTNVQTCMLLERRRQSLLAFFETKREEARKREQARKSSSFGEVEELQRSAARGSVVGDALAGVLDEEGDMGRDELNLESEAVTPARRGGKRGTRPAPRISLPLPLREDLGRTPVRRVLQRPARGRRSSSRQKTKQAEDHGASGGSPVSPESGESLETPEHCGAAVEMRHGSRRRRSSFCWPGSQGARPPQLLDGEALPSAPDGDLADLGREEALDPESVFDAALCTPSQMSVRLPSQPQRRRSRPSAALFDPSDEDRETTPLSAAPASTRLSRSRVSPLVSPSSASSASPTPSRPRRSLRVALRRRTTAGSAGWGPGPLGLFPEGQESPADSGEVGAKLQIPRTMLGDGGLRQHAAGVATLAGTRKSLGTLPRPTDGFRSSMAVCPAPGPDAPAAVSAGDCGVSPSVSALTFFGDSSLSLCLPSLTVCLAALFFWPSPMSPCRPAPDGGSFAASGRSAAGGWSVDVRQQTTPKGEMQRLPLLLRAAEHECTRAYEENCLGRWVPEFFHRDSLVEIELSLSRASDGDPRSRRAWVSVHQAAILLLLDGQEMEACEDAAEAEPGGKDVGSAASRVWGTLAAGRAAETETRGDAAETGREKRGAFCLSAQEIADTLKIEVRHLRRHLKILLVAGWVGRARRSALGLKGRNGQGTMLEGREAEGGGGRRFSNGRSSVQPWGEAAETRSAETLLTNTGAANGARSDRGADVCQRRGRRDRDDRDAWVYFLAPEESQPPRAGSPVGGRRAADAWRPHALSTDPQRRVQGAAANSRGSTEKSRRRMASRERQKLPSSDSTGTRPLWGLGYTRREAGQRLASSEEENRSEELEKRSEGLNREGRYPRDLEEASGGMEAESEYEGDAFMPFSSGTRSEPRATTLRSHCALEGRPRTSRRIPASLVSVQETERNFSAFSPSSSSLSEKELQARRRAPKEPKSLLAARVRDWVPDGPRRRHSDGETEGSLMEIEEGFRSGAGCLEATPFACGEDLDLSNPQPLLLSSLPSQRRKRDRGGHAVQTAEMHALWSAREKDVAELLGGFPDDGGLETHAAERPLGLFSPDLLEPRTSTVADFTEGEEEDRARRNDEDSPDKGPLYSPRHAFALGHMTNQEARNGLASAAGSGVRTPRDETAERFILDIMRERASNVANVLHKATPSFVLLARMQQRAKQMSEQKGAEGGTAAEGEEPKKWSHEQVLEMLQNLEREGRVRKVCGNWELVE